MKIDIADITGRKSPTRWGLSPQSHAAVSRQPHAAGNFLAPSTRHPNFSDLISVMIAT